MRLIAFLLAFFLATSAAAQTFRGTVVDDSTKRPLQSATLVLLDASGKELGMPPVRSDSLGRFVLHAGSIGRYAVRVSRIGYAPLTSATIEFFGGKVVTLNLAMSAVQQKLGTIVVTEQRRLNRYELYSDLGFELRRAKGSGHFLDTLDLQVYKTHPVQTLLLDHAGLGLHLEGPTRGSRLMGEKLVMFNGLNGNGGMRGCDPELWINGFEARSQEILLSLSADMIFGVEVFSHLQLPPASIGADIGAKQSSAVRAARCGAIVVWTKGYIKEMKAKEAKRVPPPN